MSRHTFVVAAAIIAAVGIVCCPGRIARWAALPLLAVLLTACASSSEPMPAPPAINVYQCATPAGMTAPEPQPKRPRGEYTQADVALYITELHQWGTRGWLKLTRVREHADRCAHSAKDDEEND